MKVGDLVKWISGNSVEENLVNPTRLGIILGKWVNDSYPDDTTPYWSVFMEGTMFNMDEQYLEVINESR